MRYAAFATLSILVSAPAMASGLPNVPALQVYGDAILPEADLSPQYERARQLVMSGEYAEAKPVLDSLLARTNSRSVRYLKGVASLGAGDAMSARRYLRQSAGRYNLNASAVTLLALAEVRLGNMQAARAILSDLRSRKARCGSQCGNAERLGEAIPLVQQMVA